MRTLKQIKLILVLLVGIFLSSCLNEKYKDLEPTGSAGFEFKTTKNIEVNIQTLNSVNKSMGGVYMSVYSVNPLNDDGTLIDNVADFLIHKGATNNNGKLEFVAAVPTYVDSVVVSLSYIRLPNLHMQKIVGSKLNLTIGGVPKAASSAQKAMQAPYNQFIVVNPDRGREVHLPGSTPADLADRKLFGTVHDTSNPATGKYYMPDKYLPWAINIPVSFDYPAEKQEVNKTYLMFDAWANSRGFNYMDWYMPKAGYRNNEKIFNAK